MKQIILKYCCCLLALQFCSCYLPAQIILSDGTKTDLSTTEENDQPQASFLYTVRSIVLTGNKKTKTEIILRELPFKKGDQLQLSELVKEFEKARRQLMNTTLFHEAVVSLKSLEDHNVDVAVDVRERWYIFPYPYFRVVARNFNQWLVEQKASFDNLNYGVKIKYNNVTGRNDKLSAWLLDGYSRSFSINYDRLYIDKSLKWGMAVGFSAGKTREVNYNTVGNKQILFKNNDAFLQNYFSAKAELTYRKAIKTRHRFGISYTSEKVQDTIIKLNPSYFTNGYKRVSYPEFHYSMTYFDVDYIPYPTKGYAAEFSFSKKGLNHIINVWKFTLAGSANWHLSQKNYLNLRSYFTIKLPFDQPYYNQRLLGYGNAYMQGYEYYVIDGVAGGYLKAAVTRELFTLTTKYYRKKRDEYVHVPFRVFAKVYGNAGYVHNPQPGENSLVNKMLFSGGFGIDVLTIYDFTFKLECSFNQLGQNGIFLQRTSYF